MDGLIINNNEAYSTYGVMMGEGFLDSLLAPVPLKAFVSNESRLQNGKRVITDSKYIRKGSREVTLTFVIVADTQAELQRRKEAFYALLYGAVVEISFGDIKKGTEVVYKAPTAETFRLLYTGNGVTYGESITHTTCKVSAKFEETDPTDRQ